MDLFWFWFWFWLADFSSGLDLCGVYESSVSPSVSPLVESLQCYNNKESYVQCEWKNQRNAASLQVWITTEFSSDLCVPSDAENRAEGGMRRCRYDTRVLAIGVSHTVFFLDNNTESLCSNPQRSFQSLVQHLTPRPPVNLSSSEEDDGGRRLQWSSPYPASSSLNKNLTYQLSHRIQTQDSWTTETVTNTSLKLERQMLLPGRRYEARVRTRAGLGQWSEWSPVVTWWTRDDVSRVPLLRCVLDGEHEVTCSWEVSTDLAHLVTYQLTCRHGREAQAKTCCPSPTLLPDPGGTAVTYSCSLTVADPKHLQLHLLPAHNAKIFQTHRHIRPDPPSQVTVREEGSNWIVEWRKPATSLRLSYEVCYYRTEDQSVPELLRVSEGSTSVTILGTSLTPLQDYQAKVRSLVVPGAGSYFKGIPSEWTDPKNWTSSEASWSLFSPIYVLIGLSAAAVFLSLYCTVPACQRKVMLWVDSVPSPGKSKILTEIKPAPSLTLMQSEKTCICKVQQFDSISTCSSEALLWPSKGTEAKYDQNTRCRDCENLPSPVQKVTCSDTSSMSFSGPYILCQVSEPASMPMTVQHEDKEPPSLFLDCSHLYGKDYVCLPSHNMSRSAQDLTSHGENNTNTQWCGGADQDQRRPDSRSTSSGQPSDYASEHFSSWPQVGAMQASGYCHLPTTFTTPA